jgi:hypothetical protein
MMPAEQCFFAENVGYEVMTRMLPQSWTRATLKFAFQITGVYSRSVAAATTKQQDCFTQSIKY